MGIEDVRRACHCHYDSATHMRLTKLGQRQSIACISHRPLATQTTLGELLHDDTLGQKRTRLTAIQPLTDSTAIFWVPTDAAKTKRHGVMVQRDIRQYC